MLAYLSTFDICLWFAVSLIQSLLAAVVFVRDVGKAYPAFAVFVYFSAITTPLLMALPAIHYFWAYYAESFMALILMAVSAADLYRKVIGPMISMPAFIPRQIAVWLFASLSACAVPVMLLHPVNGSSYMIALGAAQSALILMLATALWLLVLQAKIRQMYWEPWAAGICGGHVLCMTVNTLTMFLAGMVTSKALLGVLHESGQFAYLFGLIWWGWTLRKVPVNEDLSPAMMAKIIEVHAATKKAERLAS